MIRNNWPYKLAALILAIILWKYAHGEMNPKERRKITVPISVRNLLPGYTTVLAVQETNVTIEGVKSVLDTVRQEDVTAWVDMDGVNPSNGATRHDLRINVFIKLPAGVQEDEVTSIVAPKSVSLNVKPIGGKRMPVELKFLSTPPIGYAFGDPIVDQPSVSVLGESKQIALVKRVVLTVPNATGSSDIDSYFEIKPLDEYGGVVQGVNLNPSRVRLQLHLVEVAATKTVVVSPTVVGTPKFPAKVSEIMVNPPTVTLAGRPETLLKVSTVLTENISIENAENDVVVPVGLQAPQGVKIRGVGKVTVTVRILQNGEGGR